MDERILEVRDLRIQFDTFDGIAKVLDGITFDVAKGEVVALVGETGCGKSLTAKAIMGILPPEAKIVTGEIIYKGIDLLKLKEKDRASLRGKEMGMIPQNPMVSLNPVLTVRTQLTDLINFKDSQDVSLLSYYLGRSRVAEQKNTASEATKILSDVALDNADRVLESYPFQISGGMAQRVCIAMALLGNPSLVIADEPGTSLDVTIQKVILDLLEKKIRERGLTVIYITHNLAVARRSAARIMVMYTGCIVEIWNSSKIFSEPFHPYTVGLKKAIPTLLGTKMIGIPGKVASFVNAPSGCRFHPRCERVMEICRKEKPPLLAIGEGHSVACHLWTQR